MEITNSFIADKIKAARNERGINQKEIAEALNKTIGAVSQIENGSSTINAVDLFKIALVLNKPIEYFFGEEYLGDDVQTLISVIRKMDEKTRADQVATVFMILQMQNIAETLEQTPDDAEAEELGKEFYKVFAPFAITINKMTKQVNEIKEKLEEVLNISGIE